jgi:hypothetical protein
MAQCGGTDLQEALDLSSDRLLMMMMIIGTKTIFVYVKF